MAITAKPSYFLLLAAGLASCSRTVSPLATQTPWSGIIASGRAMDWRGAGVAGGILN
jgi:hypothetical protein